MNTLHTSCADSPVVVHWELTKKAPWIHVVRVVVQGNKGEYPLTLSQEMLTEFRTFIEESYSYRLALKEFN